MKTTLVRYSVPKAETLSPKLGDFFGGSGWTLDVFYYFLWVTGDFDGNML